MMADGSGRILRAGMLAVVLAGTIIRLHPRCWLGHHLMPDWFLLGKHRVLVNNFLRKHHLLLLFLGGLTLALKFGIGSAASPWDQIAPAPVPIRASGSSVRSSSSRYVPRLDQRRFSANDSQGPEVCYLRNLFEMKRY